MNIAEYLTSTTKTLTYFGIGSCPHCNDSEELDEKKDQLIPVFLREYMSRVDSTKTYRIVHFDLAFEQNLPFIMKYFSMQRYNFLYKGLTEEGAHRWISNGNGGSSGSSGTNIEVLIFPRFYYHEDPADSIILEKLCAHVVQTEEPQQLIVQEYTGRELSLIGKQMYERSPIPTLHLDRVLFDFTYGLGCSCSTNMTRYRPFLDDKGNFRNLLLLSDHRALSLVGIDPTIDHIISQDYINNYKKILNDYHVDYRRRCRGEPVLFKSPYYDSETPPEAIMDILQQLLTPLFKTLKSLNKIVAGGQRQFNEHFENYIEYDVYKWQNDMDKLIQLEYNPLKTP